MNDVLSTIVEMSGGQEAKSAAVLREIRVDRLEPKKGTWRGWVRGVW